MKRILFFTQNRWAFGSIHHGLCKELYKHNIYGNVLDWTSNYSTEEFEHLLRVYDIFVTNPEAVLGLHTQYKVPLNRICSIAHAQWDILLAKQNATFDFYPELYNFGVISKTLERKCQEWQISRTPKVVELGIHTDIFYDKPSTNLKFLGYGGANETYNFFGNEIKRPKLIKHILKNIPDLQLTRHNFYNHLCMPGYYKTVDVVIMSSVEEAGGLPMLEAAAAGRLCVGTPVGYFEENAPKGGGIVVSLDEDSFVTEVTNILQFYKDNLTSYYNKCLEIQQYACDNYDWSKKIEPWLELLT